MKLFMDEDFLLSGQMAKTLFFNYANAMPILDYHCHISPFEIYSNRKFANLTEIWLEADHYKWRLMRANGVAEDFITGDAPPFEKFKAFAATLPRCIGNPMYSWAHLELQRYFGCTITLNPGTAPEIWEFCNWQLETDPQLSARGIISRSNVAAIITTDDPTDTLEWHLKIKEDDSFACKVLPAWRPDRALQIQQEGFAEYLQKLAAAAETPINSYASLKSALNNRLAHFAAAGCRAADHGIEAVEYAPATEDELETIFKTRLAGKSLEAYEVLQYRCGLLTYLGQQYARLGWVMEIHFGVLRNVNSKAYISLGPDTGYDCINPAPGMNGLSKFLNQLEIEDSLPKTLLFSLKPEDNACINTLAGCFQQAGVKGKVQQGSAWWFNDTRHGMQEQLRSFAATGVLANFVGMLTDSRSFLSYTRHEYFRRILCNMLGELVDNGEYPADLNLLGPMVKDICYHNAATFFNC